MKFGGLLKGGGRSTPVRSRGDGGGRMDGGSKHRTPNCSVGFHGISFGDCDDVSSVSFNIYLRAAGAGSRECTLLHINNIKTPRNISCEHPSAQGCNSCLLWVIWSST